MCLKSTSFLSFSCSLSICLFLVSCRTISLPYLNIIVQTSVTWLGIARCYAIPINISIKNYYLAVYGLINVYDSQRDRLNSYIRAFKLILTNSIENGIVNTVTQADIWGSHMSLEMKWKVVWEYSSVFMPINTFPPLH